MLEVNLRPCHAAEMVLYIVSSFAYASEYASVLGSLKTIYYHLFLYLKCHLVICIMLIMNFSSSGSVDYSDFTDLTYCTIYKNFNVNCMMSIS